MMIPSAKEIRNNKNVTNAIASNTVAYPFKNKRRFFWIPFRPCYPIQQPAFHQVTNWLKAVMKRIEITAYRTTRQIVKGWRDGKVDTSTVTICRNEEISLVSEHVRKPHLVSFMMFPLQVILFLLVLLSTCYLLADLLGSQLCVLTNLGASRIPSHMSSTQINTIHNLYLTMKMWDSSKKTTKSSTPLTVVHSCKCIPIISKNPIPCPDLRLGTTEGRLQTRCRVEQHGEEAVSSFQ